MSDLSINYDELSASAEDLATAATATRTAMSTASSDINSGAPAVDAAFESLVLAQKKLSTSAADRCDAYANGYRSVSNLFEGLDRQSASNVGQLSFGQNEVYDVTGNGGATGGPDKATQPGNDTTPVPDAAPPVMTRPDPNFDTDPFVDINNIKGTGDPIRLSEGEKLPAPNTH